MKQLNLFDLSPIKNLDTFIERHEDILNIPEGLQTIPCTHGLHRFPGKFIPNIPRYILRDILPKDEERIVFDPFCGSGTTLVEAALEGKRFVGMDIDPLAVAIATAKLHPLTEEEIHQLEKFWKHHNYQQEMLDFIPPVRNLSHWFTNKAITELSSIKARCAELSPNLRLFSLIVFSSILRRVSNADDQTQKTYVSHTLPKTPPAPSVLFPVFLERALQGMNDYIERLPKAPNGYVLLGDARIEVERLQFHDIITSPPYIDSIDYVYNQMLEYFWLLPDLPLNSHDNISKLRKEPMGFRTHSNQKANSLLATRLGQQFDEFESACTCIGEKSKKEELTVRSFFIDYITHLETVRKIQYAGGMYVCVIGNSYIRGTTVDTAAFLISIHESLGYRLIDRMTYEIRRHYMKFPRRSNSGKIKQDHILVFQVN